MKNNNNKEKFIYHDTKKEIKVGDIIYFAFKTHREFVNNAAKETYIVSEPQKVIRIGTKYLSYGTCEYKINIQDINDKLNFMFSSKEEAQKELDIYNLREKIYSYFRNRGFFNKPNNEQILAIAKILEIN